MSSQKNPLSTIPQSPLPDAPPPAYEAIETSLIAADNANRPAPGLPSQPNASQTSSFRPPIVPSKTHKRSLSSSSSTSLKSKKSWFQFSSSSGSSSRTVNEVRTTVIGLVKDLVRDHSSGSPAALGILNSCAEACTSHSISLAEILQDKFIEGHSPLYWAIVKRAREGGEENSRSETQDPNIVDALLFKAAPLGKDTIAELRLACLTTSDQVMFQRLHLLPQFSSISGAERVILGAQPAPDDVTVEIIPSNEGAFAVNIRVPQYHKRIMISKEIVLEFIARNRIWRMTLLIIPENSWSGPPPGSWCISLALQEPSLPTWLDAHLLLPSPTLISEGLRWDSSTALKIRAKEIMEPPRADVPATQIVVPLSENAAFSSLQYSGSSYIPADGTLEARLEAKLTKADQT